MIETGGYDLRVVCDGIHYYPDTNVIRSHKDEAINNPQTLSEAKKELEGYGWIFKRNGKTYCSKGCENVNR